jgi:c-di-GMP-binding flagellar brake protein YcgR
MVEGFGGAERRRFKRLKVDFSVTYLVRQPPEVLMRVGGKEIETVMLDLSEEGMAIKTGTDIPLETDLAMSFMLVYAYKTYENVMQDMKIEGRVVNRVKLGNNEFRLGIHFTKISDHDRNMIADFVKIVSAR